jgi:hypothetical protein
MKAPPSEKQSTASPVPVATPLKAAPASTLSSTTATLPVKENSQPLEPKVEEKTAATTVEKNIDNWANEVSR